MSREASVMLFADGACKGNPGPGGWACILRHPGTGKERRLTGGHPTTTNNVMELTAVIEGLRLLTRATTVRVVTDSEYVVRGMQEWMPNWIANNWRRGRRAGAPPVKNIAYWKELNALCAKHRVTFEHVRGHAGHPENEECDRLAVAEARRAAAR